MVTALVLGALALTLAFTLAGMSFSHLSVSNRLSNIHQARSLAEAALAQSMERVVSAEGDYFKSPPLDFEVTMAHLPGGTGRVTFDPDSSWDIPRSTYNLDKEVSTTGHKGRIVPEKSIHFVAVGEYRGVSKKMEAILQVPTYQFALSSQGQLISQGEMTVAALDNPADAVPSVAQAHADGDLLPGHILSNSENAANALDLIADREILITGDARAAGGIKLGPNAEIEGQERPESAPADMPVIEINNYDPSLFGGTQDFPATPGAVEVADGIFRHSGDLTLQKLRLPTNNTGAIVWVDGDLTINDGVEGVGAIFATGDLIIEKAGSTGVTADNMLAVVAGKKLGIRGTGMDAAFFQGVLASGGDTVFADVTVLGAVAVGSTQVGGSVVGDPEPSLTITDANMINVPANVGFDFRYPVLGGGGGAGGALYGWQAPNLPNHPQMSIDIRHRDGSAGGGEVVEIAHFYDATTDDYVATPSEWDGFTPYSYDGTNHTTSGSVWGFFVRDTDATTPGNQEGFLTKPQLRGVLYSIAANYPPIVGPSGASYSNWDELFLGEPSVNSIDDIIGLTTSPTVGIFNKIFDDANTAYDNQLSNQDQASGTFTMDPNQFLNWESRTKILLWRDLE
jgi:hypothetical protein